MCNDMYLKNIDITYHLQEIFLWRFSYGNFLIQDIECYLQMILLF